MVSDGYRRGNVSFAHFLLYLDLPRQGYSNEYPQHGFLLKIKQNYPIIVIKYTSYLFVQIFCLTKCQTNLKGWKHIFTATKKHIFPCETSQVLLAGVSGGFPGVLPFRPTYPLAHLYE